MWINGRSLSLFVNDNGLIPLLLIFIFYYVHANKKSFMTSVNDYLWTHVDPGDIVTFIDSSINYSSREKVTWERFTAIGFQLMRKKVLLRRTYHIHRRLPAPGLVTKTAVINEWLYMWTRDVNFNSKNKHDVWMVMTLRGNEARTEYFTRWRIKTSRSGCNIHTYACVLRDVLFQKNQPRYVTVYIYKVIKLRTWWLIKMLCGHFYLTKQNPKSDGGFLHLFPSK